MYSKLCYCNNNKNVQECNRYRIYIIILITISLYWIKYVAKDLSSLSFTNHVILFYWHYNQEYKLLTSTFNLNNPIIERLEDSITMKS